MKSLFVVLLVVVVAEARQVCVPGTTFKQSCNTCFCSSDGLTAACTLMGCPSENHFNIYPSIQSTTEQPKKEVKQVCIPNTTFKQSCNTCLCNSDGTAAGCTLMGCPEDNLWTIDPVKLATEEPSNDDGALKPEKRSLSKRETEAKQVCIPDSTWKQDCNTCFCNSDGTGAGCTAMGCPPKDFWTIDPVKLEREKPSNDDGALKLEKRSYSTRQSVYGRHCEPGTTVKHYCNTCMCNKFGRVGRCTRMFCDEEMYNEDGTYRFSPNGIFKN